MDADQLKQLLGEQARDVIAQGMGFHPNKQKKVLCPLHPDKNPSMDWFAEGLMWRCHACEGKIDIYDYLMQSEGITFPQARDKVAAMVGQQTDEPLKTAKPKYIKPTIETRPLSKPFIDYMNRRKIKPETLDAWQVVERDWNGHPVYVFQYFNESNELEYVSYRGLGKDGIKGGCEVDTKSILWGIWQIDKDKPVVITEGQPDAMAVWQAGYKNVVSVPNGAKNLKWIEHCWEWLQGISEFIVFADNDAPGREMGENIKKRLHNVKVISHEKYKDANEVLYYAGEKAVLELIEDAINEVPHGMADLAEIEYKPADSQQHFRIETGFYEYDRFIDDWRTQEISVIFGRNGEGKTTFISQIIGHCIEKNVKVFLYSGEMSDQKIQDWLYRQIIGGKKEHLRSVQTKYYAKTEPTPDAIKQIKKWHKSKLYLYDRSATDTRKELDRFFEVMELAVRKFGIRLFVIDNLMAILEENADSLYSDQANFVQRCKDFAITKDVHIVLLAHPTKEKSEIKGDKGNLEKTDISGSNNIPNKADYIIAVERNWDAGSDCNAIITSLKDRNGGQRKAFKFRFSQETLRFYNAVTPQEREYGWIGQANKPPWEVGE
ncbi:MAG TPA: DnaB-like helicase C-terminal domain-containing protein [Bacteroidales bacterium]|nr:DnaB-like helicase C-terminal domain-containing protein [Bacteroidales bacterium]